MRRTLRDVWDVLLAVAAVIFGLFAAVYFSNVGAGATMATASLLGAVGWGGYLIARLNELERVNRE